MALINSRDGTIPPEANAQSLYEPLFVSGVIT